MKRPAQMLANILKKKKQAISMAESMIYAYLSHTICFVWGTSGIFIGSVIYYSEEVEKNVATFQEES